jgi:transglutaminase-like putative cysteine protease
VKLKVTHITELSYDEPIVEGYTEVRQRPRDGEGQRLVSFGLVTDPEAPVHAYRDRYGNEVGHFDLLSPHSGLTLTAVSEVATSEAIPVASPELSLLDRFDFLSPTDYAPISPRIRELSDPCRVVGDSLATAMRVLVAVRRHLRYEAGTTDVTTSADEALQAGRGVCQDFAHLMIACCRTLAVPARYVSGYIHAPGSASSAASHAWVDVHTPRQGWVALDPTHDRAQGEAHVRVAVGRDYADVPPTRGVFKGNARESLRVSVQIEVL